MTEVVQHPAARKALQKATSPCQKALFHTPSLYPSLVGNFGDMYVPSVDCMWIVWCWMFLHIFLLELICSGKFVILFQPSLSVEMLFWIFPTIKHHASKLRPPFEPSIYCDMNQLWAGNVLSHNRSRWWCVWMFTRPARPVPCQSSLTCSSGLRWFLTPSPAVHPAALLSAETSRWRSCFIKIRNDRSFNYWLFDCSGVIVPAAEPAAPLWTESWRSAAAGLVDCIYQDLAAILIPEHRAQRAEPEQHKVTFQTCCFSSSSSREQHNPNDILHIFFQVQWGSIQRQNIIIIK